jgi:hypothetical protein
MCQQGLGAGVGKKGHTKPPHICVSFCTNVDRQGVSKKKREGLVEHDGMQPHTNGLTGAQR